MKYDGLIKIATGESRLSIDWRNKELLWSELAERLSSPTRTRETKTEYEAMPKNKQGSIKDVGGFVGGQLSGGRRKADSVVSRRLLTLDMDFVSAGNDPWDVVRLILDNAALIYSTHSHSDVKQRLRLVMPLSREVDPDEYQAIARRIAGDIGIDMCDDTTFEPHRLMYWPSVSIDAPFRYEALDSPWLDADEQLARYSDWRDHSLWPVSSRKPGVIRSLAKKQGDPTEKDGIVGAFCRAFPVEDAIETFLSEAYTKCEDGRYTFTGGSSFGGLVIYDDGKFAYSHHGTDPASGKLCNAFDLVRLHLFGTLDDDIEPETPVFKRPSYNAMAEAGLEKASVREELARYQLSKLSEAFDEPESIDWLGRLTFTTKGKIEATIDNVFIIMTNDPKLKGCYFFNEFRERPSVCGDLPWLKFRERGNDGWVDFDDSGLRWYLEKYYGISHVMKIKDAVRQAMLTDKRHPVRDYLNALVWDGVSRADTLFIDYLDAEDTEYTRDVTRKSLIGAVARIMQPGCKHDHTLVLVGPQGCRKSSTLAKLGREWFSDSLYTVNGKEAYELLQGYWIIEMGEMAATRKAELEQIKQFMSKQNDTFRHPYGERTQDHPRQCVFFGSTNDDEFLRDTTGSRRFWPVSVTMKGKILADNLTDEIVDQIWAEALARYRAGEIWHLIGESEEAARIIQSEHTETNSKQGIIENYLESLVPKGWKDMDLDARRMFVHGGFGDKQPGEIQIDRVCALGIWMELFSGDLKAFSQIIAREINGILRRIDGWESRATIDFGKIYGRQRGFVRAKTNA